VTTTAYTLTLRSNGQIEAALDWPGDWSDDTADQPNGLPMLTAIGSFPDQPSFNLFASGVYPGVTTPQAVQTALIYYTVDDEFNDLSGGNGAGAIGSAGRSGLLTFFNTYWPTRVDALTQATTDDMTRTAFYAALKTVVSSAS